jgi:hypothetical protein
MVAAADPVLAARSKRPTAWFRYRLSTGLRWSSLALCAFERHAGVVLGTAHTGFYPVAMAVAYRRLRILTPSLGAYYGVVDEEYRPHDLASGGLKSVSSDGHKLKRPARSMPAPSLYS